MLHTKIKNNPIFNKILIGVIWLLLWQAAAMLIDERLILVSPTDVILALIRLIPSPVFLTSVSVSLIRITGGFILGLFFGTLLASLAGRARILREFLAPFMTTVKAIPVASFTILALFLISSKNLSVLVTFLIALPVVYSNILSGIDAIDKNMLEMSRLFGLGYAKRTVYIYFSQVLPYFKAASATACGLSWKSGVAAELIVIAKGTLGERLYDAKVGFEMAELFAWTVIVIILSHLTELVFRKLTDGVWKLIQRI
ncbi:MAG: ABC transporter permease subunit [Clostridia bacterium]|nr:ABC transporter permease subunit [Clostridia bacterium]